MKNQLLIIDEDHDLIDLLRQYLQSEGFTLHAAHDGEKGVTSALNQPFDAIILETLLPKLNGFDVLKAIRQYVSTPIIILTSQTSDMDCIKGLDAGADDYLSKPCNPQELIARLRAILRRTQDRPTKKPLIEHHHIVIDCTQRQVSVAGSPLELTNTEFNILEMLMKSPGRAFSKEELTEYALGRRYTAYDRSIDVHISNLRNKLGENKRNEDWIKTIRGFGYLFNE